MELKYLLNSLEINLRFVIFLLSIVNTGQCDRDKELGMYNNGCSRGGHYTQDTLKKAKEANKKKQKEEIEKLTGKS